jgi:mannitol/fructose-specific phosphotransferase system IIA component (Ntr-type)
MIIPAVLLDMKAKTKQEAIDELTELLLESGKISDKKIYIEDILGREKIMSTYCGYGVAIPHSVSSVVNEASFAFGRTAGIIWDENDEPVQFIMLLAIPSIKEGEDNTHIEMMSSIATLALEDEIRETWASAITVEEIIHTFKNQHI